MGRGRGVAVRAGAARTRVVSHKVAEAAKGERVRAECGRAAAVVFVGMVVGVLEADERLPERAERDVGQAGGALEGLDADEAHLEIKHLQAARTRRRV